MLQGKACGRVGMVEGEDNVGIGRREADDQVQRCVDRGCHDCSSRLLTLWKCGMRYAVHRADAWSFELPNPRVSDLAGLTQHLVFDVCHLHRPLHLISRNRQDRLRHSRLKHNLAHRKIRPCDNHLRQKSHGHPSRQTLKTACADRNVIYTNRFPGRTPLGDSILKQGHSLHAPRLVPAARLRRTKMPIIHIVLFEFYPVATHAQVEDVRSDTSGHMNLPK